MTTNRLPIGSFVRIRKADLQGVFDQLVAIGYRTVGPCVLDGAIIYDDIDSVDRLPIGILDEQDGGHYRLSKSDDDAYFDYVVGPHSLKSFLFPPRETVLEASRKENDWQWHTPETDVQPLAVIGVRACDLHAIRIQDRVFIQGPFVDDRYKRRRESLFLVAVNCRRAASTCFCHSMKCGPAATTGFDLALTELANHFVLEVGSRIGGEVVTGTNWSPCSLNDIQTAKNLPANLEREMRKRGRQPGAESDCRQRFLDTSDIRDLLMDNLEHPRWSEVAERCLACANCTMVCPTCFCSSVQDVSDLTGSEVHRERTWASCFTSEHSYMNTGSVRKSTASRYRQWLTHKLATWHDQFGTSGCTGCGRCITWCPVGIDLTEEVAAIRGSD